MFCYNLKAFQRAQVVARCVPRPLAHAVAMLLGRIGYWKNEAGRKALESNLLRVTELRGADFEALCDSNVAHFSRMIADYFLCAGGQDHANRLLQQWRGFENLEAARALGKGVILVTAHLGNWEIGGTLLSSRGLPINIITLEEPTNELTQWREKQRHGSGIKTIAVGPGHDFAFVEMIQALRRNEIVAMLVDRPYEGTGTPVQFFGATTEFSTGPALLWQHTGAAVIPAFVLENENRQYISFADPMIPLAPAEDPKQAVAENTQRIAAYFESIIRQHPEQWYNYVPIWDDK